METIIKIIIAFILVFLVIITPFLEYKSVKTINITVKNKERVVNQGGQGAKYLIFTKNEVFKDTDDIWFLKFNSSDVYNNLEKGHSYRVKVNWFRIPFFLYI